MWHLVVLPKLDQKYTLFRRHSFISKHSLFTVLYNVQYCKREGMFTDEVVLTDQKMLCFKHVRPAIVRTNK